MTNLGLQAVVLSLDVPSAGTGTGSTLLLDGHDTALVRATVTRLWVVWGGPFVPLFPPHVCRTDAPPCTALAKALCACRPNCLRRLIGAFDPVLWPARVFRLSTQADGPWPMPPTA